MGYVPGRVMQDPSLPSLRPSERKVAIWKYFVPFLILSLDNCVVSLCHLVLLQAVYEEMCRVLAAIHSVDIDAAQLADFGKRGWFFFPGIHL